MKYMCLALDFRATDGPEMQRENPTEGNRSRGIWGGV